MGSTSVLLEEAEASLSSGDWDQAIEKLEALRQQNVRTSEVYSKLTKTMALRGHFLSVLTLYLEWAESALESDDLSQAEDALSYALALRPNSIEAHEMGVRIARQAHDQTVLVGRLTELAFLHLESGIAERSLEFLSEAVECAPDDKELPLQLAELYISVGQIQAGIRQYESCLEDYLRTDDTERSIKALRSLKLLKSDDVEVLLRLGQTYLQSEQIDQAELEFRAILKLDLENKEALLQLAKVCQMQGRFRNGILALNKVLQMESDSAVAHQQMGELHLASGEKAKALESLLKAAHLNLDQNNKASAAEVFEAVLYVDQDNQSAINGLVGLGLELPKPLDDRAASKSLEQEEPTSESLHQNVIQIEEPTSKSLEQEAKTEPPSKEKKRKKRRALTRKSQFQEQKFKSKTFFKRHRGSSEDDSDSVEQETQPRLRAGLGLKDQSKPIFKLKRVPQEAPADAPESLEEAPESPVLPKPTPTPVAALESLEEESVLPVDSSQEDIPSLEEVFEQEPVVIEQEANIGQDPLPTIVDDIFDFGTLEEEANSEPASESLEQEELPTIGQPDWDSRAEDFVAEPLGELDFDSIFDQDEQTESPDPDIGQIFEPEELSEVIEETVAEPASKSLEHEPIDELDFSSIFDDVALDFPEETESIEVTAEAEPECETETGSLFPEEGFSDIFEGFDLNVDEDEPSFDFQQAMEPASLEEQNLASQSLKQGPQELDFEQMRVLEISRLEPTPETQNENNDLTELLAGTLPVEGPISAEEPLTPDVADELASEVVQVVLHPDLESSEQEPISQNLEQEVVTESPPEACDIGTLIQELGQTLELTPGDEKTRLKMAEESLRYGLLETAMEQFSTLRKLNPGSMDIVSKVVKTALWMEDYPVVEEGLWQLASLGFDAGDLGRCQERLGDLLSLNPDHKEARMLMVDVFLLTEQKKLAAWHLGQMAERWLQEEEFEHAMTAFQRLIEISPSTRAQERLGRLYETQGKDQQALQVYRELSTHFETQEAWDEAVGVLEKMVCLDPSHQERERLIALYRQTGRTEDAETQQLALAQTWREKGDFDRATSALSQVLTTNPDCFEAEQSLVAIYLESGELRKAEAHAELLAERFLQLKNYVDAVELFESWVRLAPASSRTRERLAQFYQLKGDLDGAKLEWILVTETHRGQGDFERAALSLERALELEPAQKEWRIQLAELKMSELETPLEALPHLRELFRAEPKTGRVSELYFQILSDLGLMSELGEALGQLEPCPQSELTKTQTMADIESRLAAQPEALELRLGWGELCLGLGELDLAIEQFQRLRKDPHYRFHAYRLLGLCFAKKPGFNMLDLAISQFRKGLSLENQGTEDVLLLRYQLAQVLREHGRTAQALEQLRACSELRAGYENVEAQIRELEALGATD